MISRIAIEVTSRSVFFWDDRRTAVEPVYSRDGGARVADVVSIRVSAKPAGRVSAGRLRFFAFMAIAAFMIAGPVAEQVFGVRTALLRSWTMFSAIGLGVIDASRL
ncbi:hypothetical protein [Mesorhizobium dulcispinae]|nr:hypothetical protein [Mesorhizobium sp. VK23D]MDX8520871.1 hypothetical protein [Mesorhizobium sp. VK23D]